MDVRSGCIGALAGCGLLATAGALHAAPGDWFVDGRPTAAAVEAVALLSDAESHGLDPADYAAASLAAAVQRLAADPLRGTANGARVGMALEAALQRYLGDLHHGRVDPATLSMHYVPAPDDRFDAATLLAVALHERRLSAAVAGAAPTTPPYTRLREALATVRALAHHAAWRLSLPPLARDARGRRQALHPGQAWDGLDLLARRLVAWGDGPARAEAPSFYDDVLVDAVRSFQRRHGLSDDGIVGPATWAALQVTPEVRARQIAWALERLRWTPLRRSPRMVVVNVPEFLLRAYAVHGERIEVVATMKVIVGKAPDTRTPLFDAELRSIEFSPYWNVPPSIARAELLPRLRRDPASMQREGFEFVGGGGRVDTRWSLAQHDAVLAGTARIRQRPGPPNALGDIKFVFPNLDHIFLHHTPSTGLFARERRDFSHGCIRVEQPVALAQFALRGMPGWDRPRIEAAMHSGASHTVDLADPVRVLIAYGTTLVKDGRIHFYDDLYGHDRRLELALRQAAHARPPIDRLLPP